MRRPNATLCLSILLLAACGGGGGGGGGGGPLPSQPDQFYVRAGAGNDSNDGNGPASAFRTIGAAIGRLSDGDTVIVGPGVYNEAIVDPRTGTAANPIVLRGDPSGESTGDEPGLVLIDANGVLGQDNRPLPGIRLSGVEFFEVDGFSVKGGSTAGIQIRGRGRDPLIGSRQVTIRNCQVFDSANGADGILVQDSTDVLLFNNAVFRNDRRGIVAVGSPSVSLINNTVANNDDRGIFITDRNGVASTDAFLRNNIAQSNGAPSSDGTRRRNLQVATGPPSSLDGFDSARNLIFPIGYQPTDLPHRGDINSNALFVNANQGNFRLSQRDGGQLEESPAVDAGVEETAPDSPEVDFASLRGLTTAGNGALDAGTIDLGYHAPTEQLTTGGVTWYVRVTGNDIERGTRVERALRTIGEAASRASAGDRIVVGPGTYQEAIDEVPSGREGEPILFFADAAGALTGDPPAAVVLNSGRNIPAPFRLTNVEHVIIDGFVVRGGIEAGISVRSGSRNVIVRNCQANDNDTGILVLSSDDVLVFNNLVSGNDIGIDVRGTGRLEGVRVVNNTVVDNDLGIGVGERATIVADLLVQNNLVQDNGSINIRADDESAPSLRLRHNLVFPEAYSPASLDHGTDVNEDAELETGGFRLTPSSPAVDAGDPETDPLLAAVLAEGSATTDGEPDDLEVDLGFHFPR